MKIDGRRPGIAVERRSRPPRRKRRICFTSMGRCRRPVRIVILLMVRKSGPSLLILTRADVTDIWTAALRDIYNICWLKAYRKFPRRKFLFEVVPKQRKILYWKSFIRLNIFLFFLEYNSKFSC